MGKWSTEKFRSESGRLGRSQVVTFKRQHADIGIVVHGKERGVVICIHSPCRSSLTNSMGVSTTYRLAWTKLSTYND